MRSLILLAVLAASSGALGDPQCDLSSTSERFDCFPDSDASADKCVARGCCWRAVESYAAGVPFNIPYCYYPKNFNGYSVQNQTSTGSGLTAYLQRVNPSGIADDIKVLRVEVIPQTNSTVRIRIVDPTKQRWEPPLPAPPAPEKNVAPEYVVEVTSETKLEVRRSGGSPGTTLASFDLASLVYTDRFIQISSRLPSQVIYGLGEHKGALRRSTNFSRFTFYNEDRAPAYNARLYGTHPLYINIESDGSANGVWLFNSNAMDITLQPTPAITYRPIGGILDFFVFLGPSPAAVVQQYQEMVGKPKMIPYWSLGFHLCRYGYTSTEHTRQILQKNLDAGVRIEVQWNDIDYMNQRNGFTVDPVNYKDLGSFVDQLHNDGRHYVLIVDPAVSGGEAPGQYPPYDRGLDYNTFVKDINGNVVRGKVWNTASSVFPDFTHPNATPYWTELFTNLHKQVAMDGAWIDMNEPSNMVNGHLDGGCPSDSALLYTPGDEALQSKTLCTSDRHYWSEHYNVHNMYGFTEAIATYNALSTMLPNKRPFIISRSSFSGHGFYAGHWTGDISSSWQDLKDSIPGFLEFSFYGVPMVGADICGFMGSTTEELCARWQALGAFYPFSRNHNNNASPAQDPASMGDKVLAATKNTSYWRYKLLPHLYTLFYQAHVLGTTVARPLFFEYPKDSNTYDIDEQFLWGNSLMVVPALYQDQKTINAYFPQGIWYDLQNRTNTVDATQGGKRVEISADEDTVAFFMKDSTAVFFQEPGLTTAESRKNPFGLYVFLSNDAASLAQGKLYVDDGESIDAIEKNAYSLISVTANEGSVTFGLESGAPANSPLDTVHMYGVKSNPTSVSINTQRTSNDFQYDSSRKLLSIYNINTPIHDLKIEIKYQ